MQIRAITSHARVKRHSTSVARLVSLAPPVDGLYRSILDSIHDGVYFVDPDRNIVYWNHAAEMITGYTAEEVIGRRCSDCILRHCTAEGSVLCGAGCPLERTMIDGIGLEADLWLHHKNGHRIPVTVHTTAVKGDAGDVVGCVEVFSDNSRKIVS